MAGKALIIAGFAALLLTPSVAMADDPKDPEMRSAAARERDRQIIRQLNKQELARVRERDAQYAKGWDAARKQGAEAEAYEESRQQYEQDRADYEQDMAEWRRKVAACKAGDYSACRQ